MFDVFWYGVVGYFGMLLKVTVDVICDMYCSIAFTRQVIPP